MVRGVGEGVVNFAVWEGGHHAFEEGPASAAIAQPVDEYNGVSVCHGWEDERDKEKGESEGVGAERRNVDRVNKIVRVGKIRDCGEEGEG